jgi:predicted NUDIX family phosphoesterase
VVYALDATGMDVSIRETDAMAGEFESLSDLTQAVRDGSQNFESWSELLLRSEVLTPLGQTVTL